MTLHEAIDKILRLEDKSLSTKQIADKLNRNGWYQKEDKSPITAYHIHGRTNNYPALFARNGSMVALRVQTIAKPEKKEYQTAKVISSPTKKENLTLKSSFEPIIYPDTKFLILGSLPGDISILHGEYYAHPRNRFWKIMSAIAKVEIPDSYDEKKVLLKQLKVGLWDVAHSANRKGSLDSAIKDEQPNDFGSLFKKHKGIHLIAYNGQKAEKMFDKHLDRASGMDYITLPSSSPANASISFDQICQIWSKAIGQY